jgi:hypothetical protein
MISSCKQASLLLSQAQDRQLQFADRLRLQGHLMICKRCRNISHHLEFLRTAVRRYRDGA